MDDFLESLIFQKLIPLSSVFNVFRGLRGHFWRHFRDVFWRAFRGGLLDGFWAHFGLLLGGFGARFLHFLASFLQAIFESDFGRQF